MEHHFVTAVASEVGVEAAVILYNLAYWCDKNRRNGTHYHDGLHWTYNSTRAFTEQLPYMSRGKVDRAIARLEEHGLILISNYNEDRLDRTRWYAVTDEGFRLSGMEPTSGGETATRPSQKRKRPTQSAHTDEVNEVMEHIAEVTGRRLTAGTQHIRARLEEGVTVETMKRIVDMKQAEWGNDPRMRKYVRPSTLFGPENFRKYRDELEDADGGVSRYAEYD